jgi:hypothetical protein
VQPLRNFPAFKKPEGSSPSSQKPATVPYPEPDILISGNKIGHFLVFRHFDPTETYSGAGIAQSV